MQLEASLYYKKLLRIKYDGARSVVHERYLRIHAELPMLRHGNNPPHFFKFSKI